MKITEMFRSLQGEGPIAGEPCFFIRFTGCNLRCSFCDTKFAQYSYDNMTETQVWHALGYQMNNYPNEAIVFTGGEPFLQPELIERILKQIHTPTDIWFETNGTIVTDNRTILDRDFVHVVASPKPTHTNVADLQALADRFHLFLKFVIGPEAWHENDALWVVNEVMKGGQYGRQIGDLNESVFYMPQGSTREEQLELMPRVWEAAKKHGVSFSPRLHTLTFGNRRGV